MTGGGTARQAVLKRACLQSQVRGDSPPTPRYAVCYFCDEEVPAIPRDRWAICDRCVKALFDPAQERRR